MEHREGERAVALIPAALVLLVLLPFVIIVVCPKLDRLLHLQVFSAGPVTFAVGGVLVATGLALGLWSNYVQFTRGRGTPLPMMPTQQLLTCGPYRYSRNPMTLGTLLAYLGVSVAAGTVTGIALVLILGGLLVLYLKRVEETELAERFGDEYARYKRDTPFLIPRRANRRDAS